MVNNDQPKLPTSSQIEYGEIAINYAKDHETMSIKNGNNEIVTFTNDKGIKKLINEKVADVKNGDTSIVDENKVATLPTATTSGYGVVIVDNELNSSSTNTVQNGVVTNKFIDVDGDINDLEENKVDKTDFNALSAIVETKLDDVKISGNSIVTNNIANIPFATDNTYGVVIVDTELDSGSTNPIQNGAISKELSTIEKVTAAALNDLNTRKVNVTDFEDLEEIVSGKVDDVKINNTSIVTDNIANIPSATTEVYGVVILDDDFDSGSTNPIQNKVIDSAINDLNDRKMEDVTIDNTSIVNNKVAEIPLATTIVYGVVKVDDELDAESTNPIQNNIVTNIIYDNEEVTAAALNDLNERKVNVTDFENLEEIVNTKVSDVKINNTSIVTDNIANIPSATTSGYGVVIVDDELDTESTNPIQNGVISSFIERKEIVIAAALNDLNDKVTNLSANTTVRISNLETIVGPEYVPEFNTTTAYVKGDLVIYDGKLYKFNVNHAASAWNASQVTETSVFSEIEYMVKNDYEEVTIVLQTESGTPLANVSVAVQVEGESSARNLTSDTYGRCTTNVTKGLDYTVSANNVSGYYPTTPIVNRASLPKREVIVTYIVDDTLTQEHLQVTLSYSDTSLTTASYVTVSYGGNSYQLPIVNNVAETDIPLGTVYQVSFEEINGYRTPNTKTLTAEHHGTRPLNVRYQAPVSGIKWLMTNNTERELNGVSNEERLNGEIFGLIVQTSDLQAEGCSYVIPLDILMKSASKTGAWLSSNVLVSQIPCYTSHTLALVDVYGKSNCQKILDYCASAGTSSSMVNECKNMVGGAPNFDSSKTYNVGDYVVYSGNLYTFTVQHEPGAFDPSQTSGPMKGYLMPDNVVRQCFSPAYCQLWRFSESNSQVNAFTEDEFGLSCINVAVDGWWSSSQYNSNFGVRLNGGSFNGSNKNITYYLLPVLAY